ncbi:ABC transporter substrate-binding protein [Acidisoma silvae]|uniref:ABC transporter substrate-binding protein n=1 Tax=Acidisoma silvae TaxID=2802396 RepID=A0A963YMZ6_9PROT|nr:ABC transporter substrate-binding protein [Acidisoma silvae]MCB8873757.1 ABC transporter substrate-binding protein [Acidisoma silvae]
MTLRRWLHSSALALIAASGLAAATAVTAQAADHMGGTLNLTGASAAGTIDPQINYTSQFWSVLFITNDGLVAFKHVSGESSNDVVPDLATAIPAPQDGGKTYVFTIRKGVKFSNGKDVTPDDVVATFQRIFKVSNPNAGSWYNVIVGADACLKTPATCTLAGGVVADDAANTVTFHLTQPDSEFFYKLATPFGDIVPADTAAKDLGTSPAPATGPYMITSYDPQKNMILKRNPYYKEWSKDAQPAGYVDTINYTFGPKPEDEVTAIENGQQDWMFDSPPSDRLPEMASKFPNSIHINPLFAIYYAPMNVNIAPFNNKDARLAVNYALNRKSAVNIYGGPRLAVPNCQVLPPGFPGYKAYCPYTKNPGSKWSAPDMVKAKALMKASGQIGQPVTVIADDQNVDPALGTYLVSVLNELGFKATLKVISANIQFTYIQNTKNNVQISISQWYQDYPAASDFINVLLSCGSFHPGSDASINISGFCDKGIDAEINKNLITAVTDQKAANAEWGKIDAELVDQAPWATMFTPKQLDFVSARLKNFTFSDQFHMIYSQVWVQ